MEYSKIGNTDIIVSRLGVGCLGFGNPETGPHKWTLGYSQTKDIIKKALDKELNFFDTSTSYQKGTSEQYLGQALNELIQRKDVVISTKFTPRTKEEIQKGMSAQKHIEQSINQSLKNLNTDYIDLYVYQMWDYKTPIYDIMEGLNNVIKQGKARALGISNCFSWQLAEANILAEKEGFTQFNCVQNHYNLIFREDEREMVPYCHMKNIALTPYSPLASGRLASISQVKSSRRQLDEEAKKKYDNTIREDEIIIHRVNVLADKYNCSMAEIALSWLLSRVTSPIVGVSKPEQINDIVKTFNLEISPQDLFYLEEPYIPHRLVGVMAENNPYLSMK